MFFLFGRGGGERGLTSEPSRYMLATSEAREAWKLSLDHVRGFRVGVSGFVPSAGTNRHRMAVARRQGRCCLRRYAPSLSSLYKCHLQDHSYTLQEGLGYLYLNPDLNHKSQEPKQLDVLSVLS